MSKIRVINKRLKKTCACCGKEVNVIVYSDRTYRGGHYFFKIPVKGEQIEYWECPKCYWG
ncbi:MAG: hypothetical protein ABIJ23_01300 [Candidatus Magasanikbacteria bacterium]|nr:hypothetical protein [Patescibacteria group bacterium]